MRFQHGYVCQLFNYQNQNLYFGKYYMYKYSTYRIYIKITKLKKQYINTASPSVFPDNQVFVFHLLCLTVASKQDGTTFNPLVSWGVCRAI